MANYLTLPELLNTLTQYVSQKANGTLNISTESNRAITISLEQGNITAIYFGALRGKRAIEEISKIKGGSYRFESSTDENMISHDLPSSQEVIQLLSQGSKSSTSIETTPDEQGEVSTSQKIELSNELKSLFIKFLGPIADMIFDDYFVMDAIQDANAAISASIKMSSEIEDAADAQSFISESEMIIRKILD